MKELWVWFDYEMYNVKRVRRESCWLLFGVFEILF